MKKIIIWKLGIIASLLIKKYKPTIIGITGSVGKSSTKEAVYSVLKQKYSCRKSIKSYNNELGVPLTVIGSESGGSSVLKWLKVFLKALRILVIKNKKYPEILVLEMGADKIGDINYLIKITPPKVSILTAIAPVHLESFGSMENIVKEKLTIFSKLPDNGVAIINRDDTEAVDDIKNNKIQKISVGIYKQSDIMASEMRIIKTSPKDINTYGTNFKLTHKGSSIPVFLPGALGEQHIYPSLIAAACGSYFGMNLVDISNGLKEYRPIPGRMRVLEGIKHTIIIDDSFNSSPRAVKAALKVLSTIDEPGARKFAVLGDMLELGKDSKTSHQEIGRETAKYGFDYLFTVGSESEAIAKEAITSGMPPERVHNFKNSEEAGMKLQELIKKGDIILIKGSQKTRMERAVKEIMAHPLEAPRMLVRQDKKWQNK